MTEKDSIESFLFVSHIVSPLSQGNNETVTATVYLYCVLEIDLMSSSDPALNSGHSLRIQCVVYSGPVRRCFKTWSLSKSSLN